jgi:hypothetical protein
MGPKALEELPFPTSGKKSDIINWVVLSQQRSIAWWRGYAIAITITLITYIVTGKLVFGTLVP